MDEQDLHELKILLTKYYAQKAIKEADDLWDKNNLSNRDMEAWLNEDNT
jgi:hypothetical protein